MEVYGACKHLEEFDSVTLELQNDSKTLADALAVGRGHQTIPSS